MGRLIGIALLGFAAAGICLFIAICVALDIAARNTNVTTSTSRSIEHPNTDNGASIDLTDEELGEEIFNRNCSGCHSVDGSSKTGPTMLGLYGSTVTMDDGTQLAVDDDHLRVAITDPRQTTREGFRDVMPAFDTIDPDELDALIAYIRSLQD